MEMPPGEERVLRERVAEQARFEQSRDADGLCSLILPVYRSSAESVSRSTESFRAFVRHLWSVELVAFAVERWEPTVERFGGAAAAVVRSEMRYNGAAEPTSFRTIWVRVCGEWYTTAVGKIGPV
ncbi:MAG: hypothetical protein K2X82_15490 [Gemmataceae bacterium]|nr:hypothetical protein [Gemmataceae bacterium]